MFKIIPAIDLLDNKVVRLKRGDYTQVTIYSEYPEEFARKWSVFNRIHLVDLDGAKEGQPINLDAIKKIRSTVDCELELGGGLRTEADVQKIFDLGINYAILGSVALKDKELTKKLVDQYGEKIIIGVDAKDGMISTEGWLDDSTTTVFELVKEMENIGVDSIIYTDINRDGMLTGPNTEAYQELVAKTKVKIIASGGISNIEDIKNLKKITGLGGVIVGKALYENKILKEELLSIA
ncbi:1-(5-phosphoribosyl)-5-[(5-phosphoribosylamino)methylideneamino]imidazole-4-carboxamide isomerase [bacterium]|nr:1-(5-phosphoribosyl)-5-[(5-phosphoribosylamino)methylideneamino]imidazole-4-carboxamide isomerase [bacterium]